LKDEADFPIAYAGAGGQGEIGDGLAVKRVFTVGRRIEQAGNLQPLLCKFMGRLAA